jgi:chitodextrinase
MRVGAESRDRVRFSMRKEPAVPREARDAPVKSAAAAPTAGRAPQLASSKSVPAALPAPIAVAAPVTAPPTRVASAAHDELRVASIIPSNLVEPKQSNEVSLTAGMAGTSDTPSAPDRSWLGGLLAVLGGALAAAAGARFVAT